MDVTTPQPPPSPTSDPATALKAVQPNAAGVVVPSGLREQIVGRLGDVYGQQQKLSERTGGQMQTGVQELREMRAQPRPPMPDLMQTGPPPRPLPLNDLTNQMPFYTLMAVLGGMATRKPLLNATRAMGAAIKGWHEGDMQGFERNLKQWDSESQYAIDRNAQLMASRKAIMEDRDKTIEDKESELDMLLKAHGIEDKGLGAQGKNLESMLKTLDHHEERAQQLQQHYDTMKNQLYFQTENLKIARERIDMAKQKAAGALDGLKPEAQDFWAEVMALGGTLPPYLGKGSTGPVLNIANAIGESGITAGMFVANQASLKGIVSAEKAAGTRAAGLAMVAHEAKLLAPLALERSAKFDRTSFPPINQAIKAYKENTGDEDVRRFGMAVNALVNVYSNVTARGNVTTDSARDHAMELLRVIDSPQAFQGIVDQMMNEIDAAVQAPAQVDKDIRERLISGHSDFGTADITDKAVHEMTVDELDAEIARLEQGAP